MTYVDLEYETSISIWEFEMMIVSKNCLAFFQLSTRLNSQNGNETVIFNELRHINLYWILVFPIGIIDMFTLIFIDLEYETRISIWEFEMMNVLK